MSTAYVLACHTCRTAMHFALDGVAGWRFGYSLKDKEGHMAIADFIQAHLSPEEGPAHVVRVHWGEDAEVLGWPLLQVAP